MNRILFTGGLGDVLSVEARMSDAEKYAVKEIYLATPGSRFVKEALKYHYLWHDKPIKEVLTREQIFEHAPSKYCIHSIDELRRVCVAAGAAQPPVNTVDMGIIRIFAQIRAGVRPWNGSGFAFPRYECDLVCDFATTSGDFRINDRNFTEEEIDAVMRYSGKRKVTVLGEGLTTFDEFVGYVLGCREFIGVDSASSILAAIDKVHYPDKKIFVRSNNKAWYAHRAEWYPPQAMNFYYGKRWGE